MAELAVRVLCLRGREPHGPSTIRADWRTHWRWWIGRMDSRHSPPFTSPQLVSTQPPAQFYLSELNIAQRYLMELTVIGPGARMVTQPPVASSSSRFYAGSSSERNRAGMAKGRRGPIPAPASARRFTATVMTPRLRRRPHALESLASAVEELTLAQICPACRAAASALGACPPTAVP
jgi:hypothetical protein